ncbi:MAG: DNA polymerase III subunit gamma/tau [Acidimicrobiales bacterium]
MAYQSLYRRYRPRRFVEVRGQDHVVMSLRNAVRSNRVGHAYLFSGPRGTGKTSSARILAKVLNCEAPVDGEPCGVCESCLAVEAGTSFDVHELDAASNNGVEAMRDLIEKASLGTPGRSKVYILDEVHMLSKAAEAALLKTLEDPPPHVVFVLATTDPQKVSATIVSRCQPLNFHLLPTEELTEYVRFVVTDAGLDVSDETIEAVLRQAAGSARDALSALEQAAAAGGFESDDDALDDLVEALIDRDAALAIAAVAHAIANGRDARSLAERLVAQLRDAFLSLMAPDVLQLPPMAAARAAEQGKRLGAAATVRAMEVIGETLVEFRHAPDPRLLLDVALVRLTSVAADTSPSALAERLERLERAVAGGQVSTPSPPAPSGRAALGALRATGPVEVAEETPTLPIAKSDNGARPAFDRDELTLVWADEILPKLKPFTKALYQAGRFVGTEGTTVMFALPTEPHRAKCEDSRAEVESVLTARFGQPVTIRLTIDHGETAPPPVASRPSSSRRTATTDLTDEAIDPDELIDVTTALPTAVERLTQAFPGAEIVEGDAR